jgi:TonB-dependent receptor
MWNLPAASRHSRLTVHPTRCASAVAAALALSAQGALAQEAAPAADAGQATAPIANVVTIAGTRQSVASAIDRKLRAATVVDSIVAEDIGQFPDKNVGEALSRVTGVQLSRDFGEGSQVSIRGVEPDLNRIEINGQSVLSTNGTAGRGAELRELASELIGSIDVYKGLTADLTEGGVGGTVRITTRKPLDFKKPTVGGTLSGEQSSSRGGVQPRANLYMADKFMNGKLGLLGNVVYDEVLTRNDYARNTSWRFLQDWDNSLDKTVTSTDPAVAAVANKAACATSGLNATQRTACTNQWNDYSPGIARYGIWTRDHKRSSAELTAQYQFSKDFTAFASYQANRQRERLNDRNFGTDFGAANRLADTGTAPVYRADGTVGTAGTCTVPAGAPASMVVNKHYVTSYTVGQCLNAAGQGGQGAFSTSARDFQLDVDSRYLSSGFNFKRDRLEVEGLVNTSKSDYGNDTNSAVLTQNAPGLKVTLDAQGLPHFDFPAGYSPDNPNSYVQAQLQYRPTETKNTENQAKLDFKYRLTTPFFSKVWFGVQGRKSTAKQYNGGGYLASAGDPNNLSNTADDVNVLSGNINQTAIYDPLYRGSAQRPNDTQSFINSNYATRYLNAAQMASLVSATMGRSPGTFFKGYDGVSNMPSGWASPVYANAAPFFDTSHFNHQYLYSAPGSDGKTYDQIPAFAAEERIAATYLRLDYGTKLWDYDIDGNIGMRYTRTRTRASGLSRYQVRTETAVGSSSYSDIVISSANSTFANTYNDVLPSFNGAFWFNDRFVARLGWAKAMARPRIDLLAPNATCTVNSGLQRWGGDGTDDCTAGNPNLKPYRSTNTDLSVEYYPGKDSQLSAALFKKDISSYVLEKVLVPRVDLFNTGQQFDVTMPINGQGATTKGIELAARSAFTWLPGWLGGFGGDANYTRMAYKYAPGTERLNILDGSVLPYPGMSKNSYNLSLWYDRGPWNARVAYNYRDRFFTGGNDVSGNPVFQEKTGFLDAKIQYRFNDHVTVSLEGKNLTDQAQTTDAGDLFRVNELAWSGRRYFLSVSYKN